jgi:long-chain acyl-CoA synthetase
MRHPLRGWLGTVPAIRAEAHFDGRIVRCFAQRPKNAYALLEQAVASNSTGEAIICGTERLTYLDFERAVVRCAAGLRALGIARGQRADSWHGRGDWPD